MSPLEPRVGGKDKNHQLLQTTKQSGHINRTPNKVQKSSFQSPLVFYLHIYFKNTRFCFMLLLWRKSMSSKLKILVRDHFPGIREIRCSHIHSAQLKSNKGVYNMETFIFLQYYLSV